MTSYDSTLSIFDYTDCPNDFIMISKEFEINGSFDNNSEKILVLHKSIIMIYSGPHHTNVMKCFEQGTDVCLHEESRALDKRSI